MSDTLLTAIAWVVILRFVLTTLTCIARPDVMRNPMSSGQVAFGMVLAFLSVVLAADVLGWLS